MTLSRTDASHQLDGAGLRAKRALGQNFVVDANTVRRIARLAGVEGHPHVLEIGAGLGSLTMALSEIAGHVTAVEVDEALLPLLNENVGELANVTVVHADAMQLDWPALLGDSTDWVMVANLPYNVATPLIADVLDFVPQVSRMLVMVQKEVADRFAASPSTNAYGALSVKVAFHATARVVGQVPASVFLPRPNVESSLVEITRRTTPIDDTIDRAKLFALVRMGFAKRRKMLRGSLAGSVEPSDFEAAEIAPTARAEELSIHDWLRLAHVLKDKNS
ncbi:MAG: 16S rRNA (adenine(1518)-N(6)/adenine(1519)-N(6))-dimethyltransferase RsmA [Ilumatobacteraceae bacterium]